MGRYTSTEIPFYEGLIRKTASMCAPRVELEYEDIVAVFRIKVWRALEAFDATRSSMTVERYVFSCVKNQEKDLLKRRRRGELYLEDLRQGSGEWRGSTSAADQFDAHYLAVADVEVYAAVEAEPPLIPSTLTGIEREIVVRLYSGLSQRDTALELGLRRSDVDRSLRSVREKMADWRPAGAPLLDAPIARV